MPIVAVLCFVGAYAINNSTFDIIVMIIAGILGFVLKNVKFPIGPVVIGLILGGRADAAARRVSMITNGHVLSGLMSRPIAVVIFVIALLQVLDQISGVKRTRKALFEQVASFVRRPRAN